MTPTVIVTARAGRMYRPDGGAPILQHGRTAPITLDSAALGFAGNYGAPHGWQDAHTPRTARPVRFYPRGSLGMWMPRLVSRIW